MTTPSEVAVECMWTERRRHRMPSATGCTCGWRPDPGGHKSNEYRDHVEACVLDALLQARYPQPCPTCLGTQRVVYGSAFVTRDGLTLEHEVSSGDVAIREDAIEGEPPDASAAPARVTTSPDEFPCLDCSDGTVEVPLLDALRETT